MSNAIIIALLFAVGVSLYVGSSLISMIYEVIKFCIKKRDDEKYNNKN